MDAEGFRRLALELPDVIEGEHMKHPDFRVLGKIFATLNPDGAWGVVMFTPDQQADYAARAPGVFVPASGAWGRGGATQVQLRKVTEALLRELLELAWSNKVL